MLSTAVLLCCHLSAAAVKKTVRWADDVADGGDSSAARGLTVSPATASVDLWSQLDPHDNSSLVPRPFRRGVTTRKPHVPHLSSSGSLSHDFTLHMQLAMQQANSAQAILLRAIANNQIQVEHERARAYGIIGREMQWTALVCRSPFFVSFSCPLVLRPLSSPSSRRSTCASRRGASEKGAQHLTAMIVQRSVSSACGRPRLQCSFSSTADQWVGLFAALACVFFDRLTPRSVPKGSALRQTKHVGVS